MRAASSVQRYWPTTGHLATDHLNVSWIPNGSHHKVQHYADRDPESAEGLVGLDPRTGACMIGFRPLTAWQILDLLHAVPAPVTFPDM